MGEDPPEEPPDSPTTAIEVLGGDENEDDEEEYLKTSEAEGENVRGLDTEEEDPRGIASSRYEDDECLDVVKGIPDYC